MKKKKPNPVGKGRTSIQRCLPQPRCRSGDSVENDPPKDCPGLFPSQSLNSEDSFAHALVPSESTPRSKLARSLPNQKISSSPPRKRRGSLRKTRKDFSSLVRKADGTKSTVESRQRKKGSRPLKHQPLDPLKHKCTKLRKKSPLDSCSSVSHGNGTEFNESCSQQPLLSDMKPLGNRPQMQCPIRSKCDSHTSFMVPFEDMRWYQIPLSSPRNHESGLLSKKFQGSLEKYRQLRQSLKKKSNKDIQCLCVLDPAIISVEGLQQETLVMETRKKNSENCDMSKSNQMSSTQIGTSFARVLLKRLSPSDYALAGCPMPSHQKYPNCSDADSTNAFSPCNKTAKESETKRATGNISSHSSSETKKPKTKPFSDPVPVSALDVFNRDSPDQQLRGSCQLSSSAIHPDKHSKKAVSSCDSKHTSMESCSPSHVSDNSEFIFPVDWSPPRIDFLYEMELPDPRITPPLNSAELVSTDSGMLSGAMELEVQVDVGTEVANHTTDCCAKGDIGVLEETVLEEFVVNETSQGADDVASPCKGGQLSAISPEADILSVPHSDFEASPMLVELLQEKSMIMANNAYSSSPNVLTLERVSLAVDWDCEGEEEEDQGLVKLGNRSQPVKSAGACSLQTTSPMQATLKGMRSLTVLSRSPHRWCLAPITINHASEEFNNSLEHLLQEKVNGGQLVLEAELEKSLKECFYLGHGFECSPSSPTSVEDAQLTEEHRLFLQRYSVSAEGIPSTHPGEDVFREPHLLQFDNPKGSFVPDTTELSSRNILEHMLFSSAFHQQISFIRDGFLGFLYRSLPCPLPVLRWLFQLLAAPSEVSADSFKALWDLSMDALLKADTCNGLMWCPSLQEVLMVFQKLGASSSVLLPREGLQGQWILGACCLTFHECSDSQNSVERSSPAAASKSPVASNLNHVFKFLTLCGVARPQWYSDCELLCLVSMLSKISLDQGLRNQPKEDLRQLLAALLNNIRSWDRKLQELCVSLSQLTQHHHNLLSIVQNIPDITSRGRQLRRCLSLKVITKILGKTLKKHIFKEHLQLPTLCQLMVYMKPSLLKHHLERVQKSEESQTTEKQLDQTCDLDREVCYLCHTLLTLANIVVGSEASSHDHWNYLHALCTQLDQQIMSNIRETPQLMYRSKLKNLAVRTYVKWQELLVLSRSLELYPYCCATLWPASRIPVAGTLVMMSDNEAVALRRRMVINAEAMASCRRRAVPGGWVLEGEALSPVQGGTPGGHDGDDASPEAQTVAVHRSREVRE
ncbi:protein FAM178B isoform X2 [Lissotriton helveticus]